MTRDEAQELIQRLVGTPNRMALHEFEFGWLAQEILSPQERGTGMRIGLGSYIIDRDGTVTVHGSLPVPVTISRYAAERRQGRISGRQVWPETESSETE